MFDSTPRHCAFVGPCDMMEQLHGRGPVAQLGARFHGMEEVKGSNPFRSTKSHAIVRRAAPNKAIMWPG